MRNLFKIDVFFLLIIDFIRPICLPDLAESDLFNPDEILYVTGWGWTVGCKIYIDWRNI